MFCCYDEGSGHLLHKRLEWTGAWGLRSLPGVWGCPPITSTLYFRLTSRTREGLGVGGRVALILIAAPKSEHLLYS